MRRVRFSLLLRELVPVPARAPTPLIASAPAVSRASVGRENVRRMAELEVSKSTLLPMPKRRKDGSARRKPARRQSRPQRPINMYAATGVLKMKRRAWLGLLLLLAVTAIAAHGSTSRPRASSPSEKGVELYYVKAGSGAQTVILPARLFTFEDFRWLAERYTLISYDMRNRGRSSRLEDLAKISLQADVADLEAVRRHFLRREVPHDRLLVPRPDGDAVHARASRARRACRTARPGGAEAQHRIPPRICRDRPAGSDRSTRRCPVARVARGRTITLRIRASTARKSGGSCASCWWAIRTRSSGWAPACATCRTSGRSTWRVTWNDISSGSVLKLDVPRERAAQLQQPVLTIHGTKGP